jgi:DNA-binding MarR family transcriptional regulator
VAANAALDNAGRLHRDASSPLRGMEGAWAARMGRREPSDYDLYLEHRRRRDVVLSLEEQRVDAVLAVWLNGVRFRRAAQRALKKHGIGFSQWRVLLATDRIQREYGDAMSQIEVARRLEMDEGTVSAAMRKLFRAGLVDIAPAFWSTLNRVLITTKGRGLLESTRQVVLYAAEQPFFARELGEAG